MACFFGTGGSEAKTSTEGLGTTVRFQLDDMESPSLFEGGFLPFIVIAIVLLLLLLVIVVILIAILVLIPVDVIFN